MHKYNILQLESVHAYNEYIFYEHAASFFIILVYVKQYIFLDNIFILTNTINTIQTKQ